MINQNCNDQYISIQELCYSLINLFMFKRFLLVIFFLNGKLRANDVFDAYHVFEDRQLEVARSKGGSMNDFSDGPDEFSDDDRKRA